MDLLTPMHVYHLVIIHSLCVCVCKHRSSLMCHGLCNFKWPRFPWLLREACVVELPTKATELERAVNLHAINGPPIFFSGPMAQGSGPFPVTPTTPNHRTNSIIPQKSRSEVQNQEISGILHSVAQLGNVACSRSEFFDRSSLSRK